MKLDYVPTEWDESNHQILAQAKIMILTSSMLVRGFFSLQGYVLSVMGAGENSLLSILPEQWYQLTKGDWAQSHMQM